VERFIQVREGTLKRWQDFPLLSFGEVNGDPFRVSKIVTISLISDSVQAIIGPSDLEAFSMTIKRGIRHGMMGIPCLR